MLATEAPETQLLYFLVVWKLGTGPTGLKQVPHKPAKNSVDVGLKVWKTFERATFETSCV